MTNRPDIYDPAKAITRDVQKLKKQLEQDDRDFYE